MGFVKERQKIRRGQGLPQPGGRRQGRDQGKFRPVAATV